MAVAMGTGMSVWSFCVLILFHASVNSVRASPRSIRIGKLNLNLLYLCLCNLIRNWQEEYFP